VGILSQNCYKETLCIHYQYNKEVAHCIVKCIIYTTTFSVYHINVIKAFFTSG